jgi:hypothetical protein
MPAQALKQLLTTKEAIEKIKCVAVDCDFMEMGDGRWFKWFKNVMNQLIEFKNLELVFLNIPTNPEPEPFDQFEFTILQKAPGATMGEMYLATIFSRRTYNNRRGKFIFSGAEVREKWQSVMAKGRDKTAAQFAFSQKVWKLTPEEARERLDKQRPIWRSFVTVYVTITRG